MRVTKESVNYKIANESESINMTIHLETEKRTVTLTPKNGRAMFDFTKSDPYLVGRIVELMAKAVQIAQDEKRDDYED